MPIDLQPFVILVPIFAAFTLAALIVILFRTPWARGKLGEFIVNTSARLFLNRNIYHLVKNVTLPTPDGTTQIDHVFVSIYGIFVIETKNMNGAIYGGEHQRQWIQAFGPNKYRFQNPLHQNHKHTCVLAETLGLPHDVMKPIVLFVGDAKLKTRDELPPNVMTGGYATYIKSHREQVLSEEDVSRALDALEARRLKPGFKTDRDHVRHVRKITAPRPTTPAGPDPARTPQPRSREYQKPGSMPSPANPSASPSAGSGQAPSTSSGQARSIRGKSGPAADAPPACPKCGRTMVLRTAQRGRNAGSQFWGCPDYPRCKGIINIR
jgi:hypothetical protein